MKQSETKIIVKYLIVALTLLTFFLGALSRAQEINEPKNSDYKIVPKIINAQLYKKNENYEIEGLDIVIGDFHYLSDYDKWKGQYSNGRIVSFRNENLGYFFVKNNLAVVQCSDSRDEEGNMSGGCHSLPEGELPIQLPYFPNGKYADIFDPSGKKVLTMDLSSKATCNENDKCDQPIEDSENCPQDCKKNEPKIDPAVVEKANEAQNDSQELSSKSVNWIIIAIFGIILFITGLGLWLWRRYRKYKNLSY